MTAQEITTVANYITLAAYLSDDPSISQEQDKHYELVAGELIEMPIESPQNSLIARYLMVQLLQFIPFRQLCHKDTEIVVSGARATVRIPDLIVLTEELADSLLHTRRGTITPDMPPPEVVVEVVSPGQSNEDRDYRYKRSEYAARGIHEYWIIDPLREKITVLTLVTGLYEEQTYTGAMVIQSRLEGLHLTAEQVLKAGQ